MKFSLIAILLLSFGLVACEEGPAERFGEDVDNAAEDIGNAVEDVCEDATDRPC